VNLVGRGWASRTPVQPGFSSLGHMAGFEQRVTAVIKALAPGEVVAYGEVAEEAGFPGAARAVGNVLARSDEPLPWWRVVQASGRLAAGKERDQARRLRAEGVACRDGRVVGFGSRRRTQRARGLKRATG
jgi:methylated-DNA-protein-cysteine methyltransferase-like protein